MHEIDYVCDACRRFFDCTRIWKIGKDENDAKCQHLWKAEHTHKNFSFRALKYKQTCDYLNMPTGKRFKNEYACDKSNVNINNNTT